MTSKVAQQTRVQLAFEVLVPVPRTTMLVANALMACFHSVLAVVTVAFGNAALGVDLYKTRIDFQELGDVQSGGGDATSAWRLVPVYERAGAMPFTALTFCFFALSATFHMLNATLLSPWYLAELARCRTPTRWIEYTLSAPVMILLIAYTLGIRDRAELVAIAALVAATMPYGYWTEVVARPASLHAWNLPLRVRLVPWLLGHLPQTAAWFLIVLQFYDGADPVDKAPAFVHAILWGELVLFFSFGLAQLAAQRLPPRDFYKSELGFQALSLISKGVLGGLLIANVLMLSDFDEAYNE